MTDHLDFDTLRAVVTVARNEQIRSVATLRLVMCQRGHDPTRVDAAIAYWSNYVVTQNTISTVPA
jgi:hypothetical protein